jgi:hypothetical protein
LCWQKTTLREYEPLAPIRFGVYGLLLKFSVQVSEGDAGLGENPTIAEVNAL